jgi:PIN domain nuclease of toxin-antitoxin system
MILLDTSTILFWTFAPERLSEPAVAALEENATVIINAISLWEIGWKIRQGKLSIPLRLRDYVSFLKETDRVEIQATELEVWLHSIDLDWSHRDPADRIIVASADLLGCPLISSDKRIRQFYPLTIW